MGKIVLFLLAVVVGGNAFSRSGMIHPQWSPIKPKSVNANRFQAVVDSREIEPTESCTCGLKKTSKIIGGEDMTTDEYPWMAALCYKGGTCDYLSYFCGGSLINDRYILTAAHCIQEEMAASDITALLGDPKLDYIGKPSCIEYQGKKIIRHKAHDLNNFQNDIALIRLKIRVKMTDKIRPICLPSPTSSHEGKSAYFTAWGDSNGNGVISNTLQGAELTVIPQKECVESFGGSSEELFLKLYCAKANQTSVCQTDAGGPLISKHSDGYYEQIGVSLGGMECDKFKYPALFAKVNRYLKFIKKNTKDAKYCMHKSPN